MSTCDLSGHKLLLEVYIFKTGEIISIISEFFLHLVNNRNCLMSVTRDVKMLTWAKLKGI